MSNENMAMIGLGIAGILFLLWALKSKPATGKPAAGLASILPSVGKQATLEEEEIQAVEHLEALKKRRDRRERARRILNGVDFQFDADKEPPPQAVSVSPR